MSLPWPNWSRAEWQRRLGAKGRGRFVPVHESNDCHEPGGQPTGGRFCSKDAFVPRPPRKPLPFTRRPGPEFELWQSTLFMTPRERHQWKVLHQKTQAASDARAKEEEAIMRQTRADMKLAPDTPELVELRHQHEGLMMEMRGFAEEVTRRGIAEIAKELDYPPDRLRIINDSNPREFIVGGKTWKEGGHFKPTVNEIQINIATTRGMGLVNMVAHEIQHAKFEVWRSAMEREAAAIWKDHDVFEKFMNVSGGIKPEHRVEFARRYPAHAAVTDTWGHGYTTSSLSSKMMEDDGFTDYSKAYWVDARNAQPGGGFYTYTSHTGAILTGSPTWRAIDETLAEVAAWRVERRMTPVKTYRSKDGKEVRTVGGVVTKRPEAPSKAWRKFAAQINQFYRAHGHEYTRPSA